MDLQSQRDAAKEILSRLVHDVGKYVSRTARNLPPGEIPDGLAELLMEDLFETDGKRDALALFEGIVGEGGGVFEETSIRDDIEACRMRLEEIMNDRRSIEQRDDAAMRRAAELAIEVDGRIRDVSMRVERVSP